MQYPLRLADVQSLLNKHSYIKISPKALLLLSLAVASVLIIFMRIPTTFDVHDFILDASWFMELENQLRMGHLLGRDVYFTYGPLAQVFAWMASIVRSSDSALYGYAIGNAFFEVVAVVALALALGMMKQIREGGAFFIFSMYFILNSILFLRPLLVILSIVLVVRAIESTRSRRSISVVVGLLWFASQLVTVELVVYSVLATGGFLGLCIVLALPRLQRWEIQRALLPVRSYIEVMLISFGTIILCNFGIEIFYRLSSPTYKAFDYIHYSFLIIRDYNYTMGLDWQMSEVGSIILLSMVIYTTIIVFMDMKWNGTKNFYLLIGLLIASIVNLKGAFVRSDPLHIFQGFCPFIFLFLLNVSILRNKKSIKLTGYIILAMVVTLSLVYSQNVSLKLKKSVSGDIHVLNQWEKVYRTNIDVSSIVPKSLQDAIDPRKTLLDFPYDNLIAIAINRHSLAPVLQTYNAFDGKLQKKYTSSIESQQNNLEIIYGMDKVASYQIGNVQSITRSPIIFKYIFENFKLKSDQVFRDGYVVLTVRPQPQHMLSTTVPYDTQINGGATNMLLRQPTSCSLLEMDVTIHYPLTAILGRPNQLTLQVYRGDKLLVENNLVAIENGRMFSTFFYIGPTERFYQLFHDTQNNNLNVVFDRIRITPGQHDLLGVNPDNLAATNLRCVQQHIP